MFARQTYTAQCSIYCRNETHAIIMLLFHQLSNMYQVH